MEEDTAIEYLEDTFIESHQQSFSDRNNVTSTQSPEDILSQSISFDAMIEEHDVDENLAECVDDQLNSVKDVCHECVQMNLQLQKSKGTILKLQKKCAEKAAEIKRLRASEKRLKLAKNSLEEILCELKKKNWISDEGQEVLKVNWLRL